MASSRQTFSWPQLVQMVAHNSYSKPETFSCSSVIFGNSVDDLLWLNKLRLLNELYVYVCLYFNYNKFWRFSDMGEILQSILIWIIVFFNITNSGYGVTWSDLIFNYDFDRWLTLEIKFWSIVNFSCPFCNNKYFISYYLIFDSRMFFEWEGHWPSSKVLI